VRKEAITKPEMKSEKRDCFPTIKSFFGLKEREKRGEPEDCPIKRMSPESGLDQSRGKGSRHEGDFVPTLSG